jgi:hypothetical protein
MNDTDRDVHDALARLVEPQPPPLRSDEMLAVGRRARQRRFRLAATGAAAAVVAIVAAATLLARPGDPPEPAPVAPAATSPVRPVAGQPVVPGVSPEEAARIARGCGEEWQKHLRMMSAARPSGSLSNGRPAPPPAPEPRFRADQVRLYNLVRDAAGTVGVLYAPGWSLTCFVDGPEIPYGPDPFNANGTSGRRLPGKLPVPVMIEGWSELAGVQPAGGRPGVHGHYLVNGLVDRGVVAKVTVAYGPYRATVPAVNGTFLVRFVRGIGAPIPRGDRGITVRAYDAHGRPIGAMQNDAEKLCPGGLFVNGRCERKR